MTANEFVRSYEANARLIAAAPEMLEALKLIQIKTDADGQWLRIGNALLNLRHVFPGPVVRENVVDVVAAIAAAVAKAEGRS